jgi:hypothetical protein
MAARQLSKGMMANNAIQLPAVAAPDYPASRTLFDPTQGLVQIRMHARCQKIFL